MCSSACLCSFESSQLEFQLPSENMRLLRDLLPWEFIFQSKHGGARWSIGHICGLGGGELCVMGL